MKKTITLVFAVFVVVVLVTVALTLAQVNRERTRLQNDLEYRSSLLAESLRESVEPNFIRRSDLYLQDLVERYSNKRRLAGLAIVDNTGMLIAASSSLPQHMKETQEVATMVMDSDEAEGAFTDFENNKFYVFAQPLHDAQSVVGALLVIQNGSYIDAQITDIWTGSMLRLFAQIILFAIAILIFFRWVMYAPIRGLVQSLQHARLNKSTAYSPPASNNPFVRPLAREVSRLHQSLIRAQLAASHEAHLSLEQLDAPWTVERLQRFAKDMVKDRGLVVVSNREPYIHTKTGSEVSYYSPASGMVTAIEPTMQATGGVWIAHGSGDADRLVVDIRDTIRVPPGDPRYTLKRVWLTEEEERGYYYGFSNEALYPLCLMAHTRPSFSQDDFDQYRKVNAKFSQTVLEEIRDLQQPIVFIQDFHFALLPRMIKAARPDVTIGLFWHIPWVSAENFSICPWKKELLDGMLGADIVGFHTQLHCNNFIETVGRELEALIDLERFTVTRNEHLTVVKPFPASVAMADTSRPRTTEPWDAERKRLMGALGISTRFLGLGVDRLDYTKGLLERFKAIEMLLTKHPAYRDQFTFVQISPPSKSKLQKYKEFAEAVEAEAERVNDLFKTDKGQGPIVLIKRLHSHEELNAYYRVADVCLVTSLHDGMNLVAKEFIAARDDERGVLILSQFAGASKELKDALIVNPYSAEETSEAVHVALKMNLEEQSERMRKLRSTVNDYNTYRWSAEFLKAIVSMG